MTSRGSFGGHLGSSVVAQRPGLPGIPESYCRAHRFPPSHSPPQASLLSFSPLHQLPRDYCKSSSMSSSNLVYALDFDGVICDSVGESSQAAVRAASAVWPSLSFPSESLGGPAQWVLDALRAVRPVISTGYENVLLARMLGEIDQDEVQQKFVEPVLGRWEEIREDRMREWDVAKEDLVEAFGTTRDKWIEDDVDSWIDANRMFPGVVDALNFASAPLYIITTKQTRFCLLLLQRCGVTNILEENVFGYGTGSKISILKKIFAMPEHKGKKIVFVEDRYDTLEEASLSLLGTPLDFYLASWGYNTQKTRDVAEKHPFINLLDLPTFVSKFQ